MITVKNVSKKISDKFQEVSIINDISLHIENKEFVSIMGSSGSGKSTLLGIMSGLDKPSEGEVIIDDNSIYSLSPDKLAVFRNRYIGIVFQNFNLIQNMSALENVEIPLLLSKHKSKEASAEKALEMVGLAGKKHLKPAQLSGGEQQRVAIARAIIQNPSIIFADEPTGSLDDTNTIQVMNVFKELNKNLNTTLIVVTHELDIAQQADRIIHLADGRIKE